MSTGSFISIIVPAYNEKANIEAFLYRLQVALLLKKIPFEIIVIDDRSTDGTYKMLQKASDGKKVKVFLKEGIQGKAYSLIEGFAKAKGDIFVMIDADLQYPPEAIPQMLEKLTTADIVIAERKEYHAGFLRKLMSKTFQFLFAHILFGLSTDVQSGLKVFKKDVWETVAFMPSSGWTFDLEFLHRAQEAGYSIEGHSIVFADREHGDSKISTKTSIEIAKEALALRVREMDPFVIGKRKDESMHGASIRYKKKHYVTHTTIAHHESALDTFTTTQKIVFTILLLGVLDGFLVYPLLTLQIIIAVLSFIYFIDVFFNLYIVLKSIYKPAEIQVEEKHLETFADMSLPLYSILCPLYKEAHIIPQFLKAIDALDYPKAKLDVMLLLEEDDVESIESVKKMKLPSYVRTVVVPHSVPKTKPKACNYGLAFAKGEYLVIYDAEDIPDPLQLKKAIYAFQNLPKNVVCLQAKLNYYNPHQNWLTRFFTAEYSLWFDITLTGLQSLNTNIPLGGTSNHFRTDDLRTLQGWDPFNVTEDADLGIRLFKKGYKTAIIDSVTLEEANSNFKNWLRQRSRWIKGYMQTYLVHTRQLFTKTQNKKRHSLFFHLTIGGKIAFILINPILWITTIAYFTAYAYVGPQIEALYPPTVFYMAAVSLILGNFLFIYYYMIGCMKKQQWWLVKYVYLIPLYWLMISIAGAIAFYQLIFKPHYWEKTIHGLHIKDAKKAIKKAVPEIIVKEEETPLGIPFPRLIHEKLVFVINDKKKYLSGSFLIIATLGVNVLNYIFNAYLGRVLSLSDFGLLSLLSGFIYVTFIPFTAFSTTVTYKSGYLEGKYGDGGAYQFWQITRRYFLVGAVICTVIFIAASPYIASFFKISSIIPLVIFAPILVFGFLSSYDKGYLSGKLLFTTLGISLLVEPIVRLAAGILFVQFHDPSYVYASLTIGTIATFLVSWIAALRTNKKRIVQSEARKFPTEYFFSSFIAGLSTIAFLTLDILLVKHYLSANEAGLYGLISLVGKMIFFLGTLSVQFIAPIISRNEGKNKSSDKEFNLVLLATCVLTGGAFIIFAVFPQFIVPLLLGKRAALIIPYLPMFALAMATFTLSRVFVQYYQNKRIYSFAVATFLISIVQILLFMLFHKNIQEIITIMVAVGLFNLSLAFVLHAFIDVVIPFENNIVDFMGLFTKGSRMIGRLPNAKAHVLIFNWRDTHHVFAGGAEVYIHEIAKRLVKNNYQVTIFCGNDGRSVRNQIIDGVQIIRRGGFFTVYLWAWLYYLIKFKNGVDIVIDSENGIPFFTPVYVRQPILTLVHHVHQEVFRKHLIFPFSTIAMFLEAKAMPFIYRKHKFITVSQSTKNDIIKHGLKKDEDITIITPGVSISEYFQTKKTSYPSFVYLGRLKPYKNIDIAIKAFAAVLIKHPDAKFFIAGEGESIYPLSALVKKLAIEKQVFFLGKISEKEKIELLGTSWVAVQPSQIEGWGITVIEANACGTPVIASAVNGLKDSVADGKTGILVKLKDTAAFAQAMEELVSNTNTRQTMSKNALAWAKQFSWEESSKKAEQVMVEALTEYKIPLSRKPALAIERIQR